MSNWDYFDRDRDRDGRDDRSRLFESLEEPDDNRRSSRRNGYSSPRKPFEDRPDRSRDEYRRAEPREPMRPSYDDFADNGNVAIYTPKSFSDVQAMIENLARKEPVIMNLELVENESAQRILDFMSGASYALGGSMRRIKAFTFLITPQGTGITDTDDSRNR